jgi:hypothetical protein
MATSRSFLWEDLVNYVNFMLFKGKYILELGETVKFFSNKFLKSLVIPIIVYKAQFCTIY